MFITREGNIIFPDQTNYPLLGILRWRNHELSFFLSLFFESRFWTLVPFYFHMIYLFEVSDTCPFLFPRISLWIAHASFIMMLQESVLCYYYDTRNMINLSTKVIIMIWLLFDSNTKRGEANSFYLFERKPPKTNYQELSTHYFAIPFSTIT